MNDIESVLEHDDWLATYCVAEDDGSDFLAQCEPYAFDISDDE